MNLKDLNFEDLIHIQPDVLAMLLFKLMAVVVVMAAGYLVLLLLRRGFGFLEKNRYLSEAFARFYYTVFKWIVLGIVLLLVLQQVGVRLNSLWTILSAMIAMVAIGFVAVWSILSNLLCTLMLVLFHPFRVGDEIEIIDPAMTTGIKGSVRNINLMFTTLRCTEGTSMEPAVMQVPNNLFFQKILKKKGGKTTVSLEKQLFEEKSLLTQKLSSPDRS